MKFSRGSLDVLFCLDSLLNLKVFYFGYGEHNEVLNKVSNILNKEVNDDIKDRSLKLSLHQSSKDVKTEKISSQTSLNELGNYDTPKRENSIYYEKNNRTKVTSNGNSSIQKKELIK